MSDPISPVQPYCEQQLESLSAITEGLRLFSKTFNSMLPSAASQLPALQALVGVASNLEYLTDSLAMAMANRLRDRRGPAASMMRELARIEDLRESLKEQPMWDEFGEGTHQVRLERLLATLYPVLYSTAEVPVATLLGEYFPLQRSGVYHTFQEPIPEETVTLDDGSYLRAARNRNDKWPSYEICLVFCQKGGSCASITFRVSSWRSASVDGMRVFDVVENVIYSGTSRHFDMKAVKRKLMELLWIAGWDRPLLDNQRMTEAQWKEAVVAEFEQHPLTSWYAKPDAEGIASGHYCIDAHTYDAEYEEDLSKDSPISFTFRVQTDHRWYYVKGTADGALLILVENKWEYGISSLEVSDHGRYDLFQQLVSRRRMAEKALEEKAVRAASVDDDDD